MYIYITLYYYSATVSDVRLAESGVVAGLASYLWQQQTWWTTVMAPPHLVRWMEIHILPAWEHCSVQTVPHGVFQASGTTDMRNT